MGQLIYTAICSVDGYIADEDDNFDWAMPSEELHAFINARESSESVYLYGRRMYETMQGWETEPALAEGPPLMREFAEIWQAADKIVYSTTLERVTTTRTTLERSFDADAVQRLKERTPGDLAIAGPTLAAHAFNSGLVDRCDLYLVPHAVGGGNPALPRGAQARGAPHLRGWNHAVELRRRAVAALTPAALRARARYPKGRPARRPRPRRAECPLRRRPW